MGCISSKHAAAPPSPVFDDSHAIHREHEDSAGVLANSLWARDAAAATATDRKQSGEPGKVSSTNASTRSIRLGNLHNYIEGEQLAAGWPAWLTSVAKEAIQGWVPLRADSYEKLEKIGQGTYSSVFRARDLDSGKLVALKKVRFDNFEPESVRFMAREIMILRRLDHPNIIKLQGLITSRLSSSMYLVFDYMEHDLAGLSSSPDIKFNESQIKCYTQQLLSALAHCHSRGIMHRDIKCANLLVNNEGVLKMADFGLANFFDPGNKQPLTSRVVTLWYRPPELLLGSTDYEASVDLWSVGCVFAEMFLKKPILQGRTEVEQIHKIFKLCGSPPEEYWKKSKLPHATLFKPHQHYENCLRDAVKSLPESAVTLLETLLSVEPYKRGTASTALMSQYFTTKPYACDPSSLPKYPPNKEIDAKYREDLHRKKITARGHDAQETRRPSRLQSNVNTEETQIKTNGVHNSVKKDLPHLHGDARLIVDMQPMPAINPSERRVPFSGPLPVSASNSFAWAKGQKEDHDHARPYSKPSSKGRNSCAIEPLYELQTKNIYDSKGQTNGDGINEAFADSKSQKPYDMAKHAILKQLGQLEHPGPFDGSGMHHSRNSSEEFGRTGMMLAQKHGFQDKGDKVEFSGPLLSQPHQVDELLEKHERQMRQAVRKSWFQRVKK